MTSDKVDRESSEEQHPAPACQSEEWELQTQDDELERQRPTVVQRLVALLTVLVFIVFALSGLFRMLEVPDLSFLSRSRELAVVPEVREWQRAVVQIESYVGQSTRMRSGTGFNISPAGLVVTNRHVVEDSSSLVVTFRNTGVVAAEEVHTHPLVDLAVVKLKGKDLPVVAVDPNSFPPVGAQVTVIGNPLGFPGIVAEGKVISLHEHAGCEQPLMEISAPIHPGSSGSPVFNVDGAVVAVVYAVLRTDGADDDIRALAIPVSCLEGLDEGS